MLVNHFRSTYMPSSRCSIDEMMVWFTKRSKHSMKVPNNPINEEYKYVINLPPLDNTADTLISPLSTLFFFFAKSFITRILQDSNLAFCLYIFACSIYRYPSFFTVIQHVIRSELVIIRTMCLVIHLPLASLH